MSDSILFAIVLIFFLVVSAKRRSNLPPKQEPPQQGHGKEGGVKLSIPTRVETAVNRTYEVGQGVYMFSGCYMNKGKVVKVTPSGVDVQTGVMQNDGTWNAHELLHFDNNGRSYVTELPPSYDPKAHPASPWGWKGNGTYECGPWYIDGMPFAEREALYEQLAQKFRKWRSMNCEHSRIGEHYYIEKCPICGCENPNYDPIAAKERLQGLLPK
jgi:hypothetical protein